MSPTTVLSTVTVNKRALLAGNGNRGEKMSSSTSLSSASFYGSCGKRKHRVVEKSVEKRLKEFIEHPLPKKYHGRIIGPPASWDSFYRQQDAFDQARKTSKDLKVFAYESDQFNRGQGQRMYVAVSYPVFWHMYSQLTADQRHHYEVIPEGSVCKLYFDLEFLKEFNPDCDGPSMTQLLIQYVCCWLSQIYHMKCNEANVLVLDSSTDKKFSRHLIFLLPSAAFKDNIHIGNFVLYIFGKLSKYIKRRKPDVFHSADVTGKGQPGDSGKPIKSLAGDDCLQNSNQTSCDQNFHTEDKVLQNDPNVYKVGNGDAYDGINSNSNHISEGASNSGSATLTDNGETLTNDSCFEGGARTSKSDTYTCNGEKSAHGTNSKNANQTDNPECATHINSSESTDHTSNNDSVMDTSNSERTINSHVTPVKSEDKFLALIDSFQLKHLESLFVKDKQGETVLFCDTGVYTKNRNFRLYLSSKLGKRNPLVVSPDNGCCEQGTGEKEVFYKSLISNVSYSSDLKILTFENRNKTRKGKDCLSQNFTHNSSEEVSLEGYSVSPYPEVDEFITSLLNKDGVQGSIRHWTYFSQGELLLFEISHYRWCHNVQRHHKSNNIMYIADLSRGVYYQKCHDPECRSVHFKSPDCSLPENVLPAYYFNDQEEDIFRDSYDQQQNLNLINEFSKEMDILPADSKENSLKKKDTESVDTHKQRKLSKDCSEFEDDSGLNDGDDQILLESAMLLEGQITD